MKILYICITALWYEIIYICIAALQYETGCRFAIKYWWLNLTLTKKNWSLLWKIMFSFFSFFIKNPNYKIWNMLGERYVMLFIANLFVRQAHDTNVRLILQIPAILETFHTIILMKKMNLPSLWIIELSPAVIFKITSVLRYVENKIYWAAKAFFIRGIELFWQRKSSVCLTRI